MTDTHAILSKLDHQAFISGSQLAQQLNVSRTAIWKSIANLKALGIDVYAVKGKGYRLAQPVELLSEQAIRQHLPDFLSDSIQIEIKSSIPSTNTYMASHMGTNPDNFSLCLAEQQTAGKGRLGRAWISPFAANIYMSCLWQTSLSTMQLASSSLSVALAVVAALTKIGVEEIGIKWPNDIYWRDKKLAGILIESSGEAYGKHNVTIGIGLNVNMPAANARKIDQAWTDLREVTGKLISRNSLIALVVTELHSYLERFEENGINGIADEWQDHDILYGRKVRILQSETSYAGVARGIDQNGALIVETEDGSRQVYGGEVSCRLSEQLAT